MSPLGPALGSCNQHVRRQKLRSNQGAWQETLHKSERLRVAQAARKLCLRQAGLTPRHLDKIYEILPNMPCNAKQILKSSGFQFQLLLLHVWQILNAHLISAEALQPGHVCKIKVSAFVGAPVTKL